MPPVEPVGDDRPLDEVREHGPSRRVTIGRRPPAREPAEARGPGRYAVAPDPRDRDPRDDRADALRDDDPRDDDPRDDDPRDGVLQHDDPLLDPARHVRRAPLRPLAYAVAGLAVFAAFGALGYAVAGGFDPADPVAGADPTGPSCPELVEPDHVTGAGPGSTADPLGVVLAFDHGYYVARSADAAFTAVSPRSRMTRQQVTTEGIEGVAAGTRHCVDVRRVTGAGSTPVELDVELRESSPAGAETVFWQRVVVERVADGRYGILSIAPR